MASRAKNAGVYDTNAGCRNLAGHRRSLSADYHSDEEATVPAGFLQNLVIASELQRYGWTGDRHAACPYSRISPPRTLRRRLGTEHGQHERL
jgi:hypothetical protein